MAPTSFYMERLLEEKERSLGITVEVFLFWNGNIVCISLSNQNYLQKMNCKQIYLT